MEFSMYICPKCKKVFKVKGNNKKVKCSSCNQALIDMNISIEDWEKTPSSTKDELKTNAVASSIGQAKLINESSVQPDNHSLSQNNAMVVETNSNSNFLPKNNSIKNNNYSNEPSAKICPKCNATLPNKSKFCLECGYNFEEKHVQGTAQTQNSFFSSIPEDKHKYDAEKEINDVVNRAAPIIAPTVDAKKPKNVFLIVLCSVLGTLVLVLGIIFVLLLKSGNLSRYSGSVNPLSQDTMDKEDSIGEETPEGSKADEENEENGKKYEEQRKYYGFVQEAVTFTKTQMKHPATFKVSGVIVIIPTSREAGVNAIIEYEADNDLGNSVSNYARYFKDVPKYLDQNVERAKSTYINDEVIINSNGDSEHTKKEENSYTYKGSDASYYVFKLNSDDYKASGYAGLE